MPTRMYEYLISLGLYTRTKKSCVLALLFVRLPRGDVGCSAEVAMVDHLEEHRLSSTVQGTVTQAE